MCVVVVDFFKFLKANEYCGASAFDEQENPFISNKTTTDYRNDFLSLLVLNRNKIQIIFISHDARDRMMSFCMPFHCLRDVKLEQPVFGANYLRGTVLAQPGGNWEGETVFKISFNKGGCIEFGEALLHAVNLGMSFTIFQKFAFR